MSVRTDEPLLLLTRALPRGCAVVPAAGELAVADLAATLARCPEGPRLVVVPTAGPVAEVAALARIAGARTAVWTGPSVPAAALRWDVDYVAADGALAGRSDWLRAAGLLAATGAVPTARR